MGPELLMLFLLTISVHAGPLNAGGGEIATANITESFDVCVVDNVEYKTGDEVASLGPCERCVCQAPDVVCSMVKCQPNSGCRIIQQSGQCCPEYKCDCEYNGRMYNNGERLENPEDPCQVCYCKGGEVMCTSITCYERDDCEPHFLPGQCCPRYDHCPVEASRVSVNSVRSVNASLYSPKREMQPWPLTKPSNIPSTVNDESNGSNNNVFPRTIKIVEILPTTQGYVNKPSEVSVIPRVKSNDQGDTKNREIESIEESTTTLSPLIESLESSTSFGSSTSEIEHLLDTTPESYLNDKQKSSATPERSVSTLNPLSEDIHATTGPDPQPDSHKFATIYPSYYHTQGEFDNLEEATTAESVTEQEGSGYEVLTGGIYEELSSESTLGSELETEIYTEVTTAPSEDILNTTGIELYTDNNATESGQRNDTSSEVDSLNGSSEVKLQFAPLSIPEESNSNEFDSKENFTWNGSSESFEAASSEIVTDSSYSTTPVNTSEFNPTTKNYEVDNETSSDSFHDNYTFTTEEPSDSHSTSEDISTSTLAGTTLSGDKAFNENTSSMDIIESGNETSTQHPEGTEIYESTSTEYDLNSRSGMNEYVGVQARKKTSRLAYRDVESRTVGRGSETPSVLTFPSVLNIHSLGYNQGNGQTESVQPENVTSASMAKVGIYHPSKPNELAGYLTVVDDKNNASTADAKIISSQILLTPNDLKKLAEILIHEKIKPAFGNEKEANKKPSSDDFESSSSGSLNEHSMDDSRSIEKNSQSNIYGSMAREQFEIPVTTSYNTIKQQHKELQEETKSNENTNKKDDQSSNDSRGSIFQDELVRNFVSSTLPSSKPAEENTPEDPNTSRQVRVREEGTAQYSALLDDKDLLILENFFRKNMGLQ